MTDVTSKTGFITDAFIGALEKNDEMKNDNKTKEKEETPVSNEEKESFTTDAFCEALKINEETNKR